MSHVYRETSENGCRASLNRPIQPVNASRSARRQVSPEQQTRIAHTKTCVHLTEHQRHLLLARCIRSVEWWCAFQDESGRAAVRVSCDLPHSQLYRPGIAS